jgi:hypothetical protein
MSTKAITYLKTLDVDNPTSRLLLFIIGENTFNGTRSLQGRPTGPLRGDPRQRRTVREHIGKLKLARRREGSSPKSP